jgi:hypothetical protein
MGTRVVPTPSSPRKRGCPLKFATLAAGPLLVVALTAASCDTQTTPPSKSEQSQQQYRNCVNIDRRQATQDRCQIHVWGRTFGEDDPRWDCAHMGNWSCGPESKNEKQENH